jgi:hypothetical protein
MRTEIKLSIVKPKIILVAIFTVWAICGCGGQEQSKYFKRAGNLKYFYSQGPVAPLCQRTSITGTLPDGHTLLFGGVNWDTLGPVADAYVHGKPVEKKCEIYDPSTGFSEDIPDSPFALAHKEIQVTTLPSNKMLVTGPNIGEYRAAPAGCECASLKSDKERDLCQRTTALLFDPATYKFRSLVNMRPVRSRATTTLLPNGNVLLLGGNLSPKEAALLEREGRKPRRSWTQTDIHRYIDEDTKKYKSVQIFDANTDRIKDISVLPCTSLSGHSTTLVDKSSALIIGGESDVYKMNSPNEFTTSSEFASEILLFDFNKNTYRKVGTLNFPRILHTTISLGNGRFLIVSGLNYLIRDKASKSQRVDEIELFDLNTGQCKHVGDFSTGAFVIPSLLKDGRVLLIGGEAVGMFDPSTERIRVIDRLLNPRIGVFVTQSSNGDVFVYGGEQGKTIQLVERFDYAQFVKEGE